MTVPEQLRAIADRIERGEDTAGIVAALRAVARDLEHRPTGLYTIAMRKENATWFYTVKNPVGGVVSGSETNVPHSVALRWAMQLVPPSARYLVIVNGDPGLEQVKPDDV